MANEKKVLFDSIMGLSYLTREEQQGFLEAMDMEQSTSSLFRAQRSEKLSREGSCTLEVMVEIIAEMKKGELDKATIKNNVLKKYSLRFYTPRQMQDIIIKFLGGWHKKGIGDMER